MKLLVLTSEPISAQKLREAVGGNVDPTDAEVMVVTPALQENPVKFWLSDADDAIARAEEVRRETVEQLSEDGISASADTGESDPLDAVGDALATFPADRIVIFTHPRDRSRYREDIDPGEVRERFGVPVDRATVRA
jgi:hypothetical protein